MDAHTTTEVVGLLVGYTYPTGESEIDKIRYKNQEKLIDIIKNALEDLIENAKYKDSSLGSESKIGKSAHEAVMDIYVDVNNYLDNI